MCFTYEMSIILSLYGCATTGYFYIHNNPYYLTCGYFTLMEILQTLQYYIVADTIDSPECNSIWNKLATFIGVVHICYQPYVVNLHYEIQHATPNTIQQFAIVKRLCIVGGTLLLSNHLNRMIFNPTSENLVMTDLMNGDKLCTYRGNVHIAWSIPMTNTSYYLPSSCIHFFLFFVPVMLIYDKSILEKRKRIYTSIGVLILGPWLASTLTSNIHEVASIWCFTSILLFTSTLVRHIWVKKVHHE